MKLFKKAKKGFTLIELVVVIAVIAILSAVSIVSYVAITNRAKESNDHMVIDQVNTALTGSSILSKKATVHEIVDSLVKEEGFDVRQIKPELKDAKFVYLYEENTFGYWKDSKVVYPKSVEGKGAEAGNDIWFFEDTAADKYEDEYSHYLKSPGTVTAISTKGGLDLGDCTGISSVSLTRDAKAKKDLIIRTNGEGTSLVVNAPLDTVHHYDYLDALTVKAVDPSHSYHEHGTVRVSASIESGHFVVENGGSIKELNIPETTAAISVDLTSGSKVEAVVIDDAEATINVTSGAKVEQVVGNTEKISGSGAAEAKANAEEKTLVYNVAEEGKLTLRQALDLGKKYIVFAEDLTVTAWNAATEDFAGASVTYDLTIDGNGHTLTGDNTVTRGIWVDDDNVKLSLKNMTIAGNKLERAVQVNSWLKNVSITMDNITSTVSYYAVNVCGNTQSIELSIINSNFTGYGALNIWGLTSKAYVSNSVLTGYNDKGYDAEGWNDFGTVIVEGDTTGATDEHASSIEVRLVNSTIKAQTSGQGNKQWCILFNEPSAHNTIYAQSCKFEYKDAEKTYLLLGENETNHFYKDGELVVNE